MLSHVLPQRECDIDDLMELKYIQIVTVLIGV